MIAHVELDLVDDSELGEIDQKDFYFWLCQDTVCAGGRAKERIFHTIGSVLILDPDANPHRMDFRWIVKIDDRMANHLVVRDIEINAVVCAQPRRAPVNLHYFGKALAHLQPVTDFVGPVNLDRYAADDPGKQILPRKSDDDCDYPGAREQAFQLRFGVITGTQDKEKRDQKNDPADNLTKKMRDQCLPFLFEIEIPNVPIDQSDHERCAQQDNGCADMISPGRVHAVKSEGGVERKRQTEEPEQEPKPHTCAPFQKPANRNRDK